MEGIRKQLVTSAGVPAFDVRYAVLKLGDIKVAGHFASSEAAKIRVDERAHDLTHAACSCASWMVRTRQLTGKWSKLFEVWCKNANTQW